MRHQEPALKGMAELIEFDTERLLLRQWRDTDRESFAALNADPRVMVFFPALLIRTESDAIVDRCECLISERGWGVWAVDLKTEGDFIGFVGLHTPTDCLPFAPCTEVLWRLAFDYWGAARGALRVGFERLGLPEIVSFAAFGNTRSRAVMERLGMFDTKETFEHPNIPIGHVLSKHCLYRLSLRQWLANDE
jgi:RimJ/RimL family protein N-acetyltransferase